MGREIDHGESEYMQRYEEETCMPLNNLPGAGSARAPLNSETKNKSYDIM